MGQQKVQLVDVEFILMSTVSTLASMTTKLTSPGQLSHEDQSDVRECVIQSPLEPTVPSCQ